ncbi:hypothetical protein RN001_011617 [Aquatica leii]|uniref:RRM domain-containing protein n=1 Tax=Aquatica leii TaxID=1421715 RepID=A0AAN7Q0X0_9COLE|nr:hypothetical protein RN001_011617 [Aquatica leii]
MKTNFKRKLEDNHDSTPVASYKKKKKNSQKDLKKVMSTGSVEAPVGLSTNQNKTKLKLDKKRKREKLRSKNLKSVKTHTKLDKVDATVQIADSKKSQKQRKNSTNNTIVEESIGTTPDHVEEGSNAQINNKNERTLFVGNVGITTKKEQLLKAFRQYGKIESIRLRGITPADPKTPKRLAAIKRTFHPKRTSFHSYVVFQNTEDAIKATSLNGTKLNDHIIRVELCNDNVDLDPTKAIFIGNIPFDTEENDLWNTFDQYGKIVSVRLIRNSETGMCIGIGYVNFESSDAVELVLMADSIMIKTRELRIQRYSKTKIKKSKEGKRPLQFKEKKLKSSNTELKKPKHETSNPGLDSNVYQGSKFVQRKKKKKNKTLKQNMKMIKKIAPR